MSVWNYRESGRKRERERKIERAREREREEESKWLRTLIKIVINSALPLPSLVLCRYNMRVHDLIILHALKYTMETHATLKMT